MCEQTKIFFYSVFNIRIDVNWQDFNPLWFTTLHVIGLLVEESTMVILLLWGSVGTTTSSILNLRKWSSNNTTILSSFSVFLSTSSTNEATCSDFKSLQYLFHEAPSFDLQHLFTLKPCDFKYLSRNSTCIIENTKSVHGYIRTRW